MIFEVLRRGLNYRSRRLPQFAPFPPLPIELIRNILELAAAGDRSTALRLVLVSNAVRSWIVPLIFRTVALRTSGEVISFHDAFVSRFSSPYAASQVRNLFVRCVTDSAALSLAETLSACKRLDRLALDTSLRQPLDPRVSWPAPWEVVFMYGSDSWILPAHPVLRNVTHLHLNDVLFRSTLEACKRSCPRLTHLGISHQHTHNNRVNRDNFVRLIRWLLESTPSLQMVLLHCIGIGAGSTTPEIKTWPELCGIEDERLLARTGLEDQEYCEMLETGTTIWDDAKLKYGNWRVLLDA